jgi:hypothetical protein
MTLLKDRVLEIYIQDELLSGFYADVSYSKQVNNTNPNVCNINLINFEKKINIGADITIKAGYENQVNEVFQGIVSKTSKRVARNRLELSLNIEDSLLSYRRVLEPFKTSKGSSLESVIKEVIKKAKLKVGVMKVPNIQIDRDYSFYSYPILHLDKLARSFGFYYIIDKGFVSCYTTLDGAFLLNSDTGLLDYEVIEDIQQEQLRQVNDNKQATNSRLDKITTSKKNNYFVANCLFIPDLKLENQVRLEKENLQGVVKSMSVNLSNYNSSFYMSLNEVQII